MRKPRNQKVEYYFFSIKRKLFFFSEEWKQRCAQLHSGTQVCLTDHIHYDSNPPTFPLYHWDHFSNSAKLFLQVRMHLELFSKINHVWCWVARLEWISRHATLTIVHKPLRVIHTANYLSKAQAVFSWPVGLQILSREMVTSSAQILCKAYASS